MFWKPTAMFVSASPIPITAEIPSATALDPPDPNIAPIKPVLPPFICLPTFAKVVDNVSTIVLTFSPNLDKSAVAAIFWNC